MAMTGDKPTRPAGWLKLINKLLQREAKFHDNFQRSFSDLKGVIAELDEAHAGLAEARKLHPAKETGGNGGNGGRRASSREKTTAAATS